MKQVTIENVRERIKAIASRGNSEYGIGLTLKEEFELACLRMLETALYAREPFYYLRVQVRADHAEWSQATFGSVGPIGPLKHLAKEAMEAAAAPGDLSEWADMQFLLWDAQRRAGITDEQITQAMIDKLAVNKARQWPEPKDGEPRLHVKEQPAPDKYNIGEATMLHIFTATGMTDVSDMQAVFDQVEKVLVKLERKPKVIEPDGWRDMMTRLANGLELMTSLASERAISVDTCVCLEWVRDARAMLNQAQEPATDNTAQQFEALATSAQPEIIGYEHRMICGELRRVPKFAGQDIEATSKAPDALEARRRRNRESNRRARALETPEHAKQRRQRNRERMRAARSGKP